jgi:hypothetical protein
MVGATACYMSRYIIPPGITHPHIRASSSRNWSVKLSGFDRK